MSSILIVDSDGKALAATQRRLRKKFESHIALGARQGLRRMEEDGPYGVVIAEFSMPEIDGVAFLAKVRERWPETTRILLSRGRMEVPELLRAINEAKAYHLLSASCEDQVLESVIGKGLDSYKRIASSTRALNETCAVFAKSVHEIVSWLRSDVREMLSPILPVLRGVCARVGDPDPLMTETALLVSVIGLISLPTELLEKIQNGGALAEDELLVFAAHPVNAIELIHHLPQMTLVEELLRGYTNFLHLALLPVPEDLTEIQPVPMGSYLLAMIMGYRLATYVHTRQEDIIASLRTNTVYPRAYLNALEAELVEMDQSEEGVPLDRLQPGMVLTREVTGVKEGKEVTLVPEGYELSRTTILFLRQTAKHGQVREPVYVRSSSLIHQADNGNA